MNANASLTFNSSIDAFDTNLTLNGGTLYLTGGNYNFKNLSITSNSVIDFGANSSITFDTVTIDGGKQLTINNWQDLKDYFFSETNVGATGTNITPQVKFTGYTGTTSWIPFDGSKGQITTGSRTKHLWRALYGCTASRLLFYPAPQKVIDPRFGRANWTQSLTEKGKESRESRVQS